MIFTLTRFSTAMDGGGSMQQRRFCTAKTRVQELTRTSILGHSQPQAKIVVAIVWVVVVPIRTSGVIRVILPAAAAFDTVLT